MWHAVQAAFQIVVGAQARVGLVVRVAVVVAAAVPAADQNRGDAVVAGVLGPAGDVLERVVERAFGENEHRVLEERLAADPVLRWVHQPERFQ